MAYALGVDVGTTFTAAAVWSDGRTTVLPLGRRSDAIPTVLCLGESGWLVGDAAERRALTEPERVARTFKRRMGDDVPFRVAGHDVRVERLTAEIIRWVVDRAAESHGDEADRVLLTHPAEWGEFRVSRLRKAADLAGVDSVELAPEPIAAASYYALRDHVPVGSRIGIYDLGGGTFDASIVLKDRIGFRLCGSPVGEDIGGIDLDQDVFDHVGVTMDEAWLGLDPEDSDTLAALGALRAQVVLAKEALSDDERVVIPVLLPGVVGQVPLCRADLERMAEPMVDRTVAAFRGLLRSTNTPPDDLSAVLLVGGTSRMPLVARTLSETLGVKVVVDAHPKYAVCLGAASLAAAHIPSTAGVVGHNQGDGPPAPHAAAAAVRPIPSSGPTVKDTAGERLPSISLIADLVRSGLAERDLPRPLPVPPPDRAARHSQVITTEDRAGSRRPQVLLLGGLLLVAILVVTMLALSGRR